MSWDRTAPFCGPALPRASELLPAPRMRQLYGHIDSRVPRLKYGFEIYVSQCPQCHLNKSTSIASERHIFGHIMKLVKDE